MNRNTRWKRRILREHRRDSDFYVHEVLIARLNITRPNGKKVKASIGGFRACARCDWARESRDSLGNKSGYQGMRASEPIVDEVVNFFDRLDAGH